MRILITNDDSVEAEQLLPLIRACRKFGEVTTVVPRVEQSAKSHVIEIHMPFRVEQCTLAEDVTVYTVDSTPADCVRYAVLGMGLEVDLIVSGINRGYNIGSDIIYSGTVAAASEATVLGIPAVALSTSPEYYPRAVEHLDEIYAYFCERKLFSLHHTYNVNIPEQPKGIRITRQGGPYYSDSFVSAGEGLYQASGREVYRYSADLTLDTDAVMSGYISVMPLSIDMTARAVYEALTT